MYGFLFYRQFQPREEDFFVISQAVLQRIQKALETESGLFSDLSNVAADVKDVETLLDPEESGDDVAAVEDLGTKVGWDLLPGVLGMLSEFIAQNKLRPDDGMTVRRDRFIQELGLRLPATDPSEAGEAFDGMRNYIAGNVSGSAWDNCVKCVPAVCVVSCGGNNPFKSLSSEKVFLVFFGGGCVCLL